MSTWQFTPRRGGSLTTRGAGAHGGRRGAAVEQPARRAGIAAWRKSRERSRLCLLRPVFYRSFPDQQGRLLDPRVRLPVVRAHDTGDRDRRPSVAPRGFENNCTSPIRSGSRPPHGTRDRHVRRDAMDIIAGLPLLLSARRHRFQEPLGGRDHNMGAVRLRPDRPLRRRPLTCLHDDRLRRRRDGRCRPRRLGARLWLARAEHLLYCCARRDDTRAASALLVARR